jgi:hypothetical protein
MAFKKTVRRVELPPQQSELLQRWYTLQAQIAQAKETEAKLRTLIVSTLFAHNEGSETIEIGNGYKLTACKKLNINATNANGETQALLALLPPGIRESLIDWKPAVSTTAYRELMDRLPALGPHVAQCVSDAITVKPGMPTLEIIAPKPETL